ncbi:DNA primase [Rufibacter radiotolerans]|uniref:DNA primase n=1 Tax=Rufibacter radiotolerans TaxID=1379910 RepID=A0A0H4VQV3_9BACT|nr:DNA primase [Rufibacter radiotolerans]AKQ46327.1 DNA primase [Rufibacter radiotolerans]
MALIKKEVVDQIILQADIVEVVGDFVSLKKKGQNMWACCPFHHEKSPSFSVAPNKGIYKCFGCGKAGNSVQFIMDVEGTSYVEALKYLAKKYSIDIEEDQSPAAVQAQNERDSLYIISDFAKEYYVKALHKNDEGQSIGAPYFKQRGLSAATIQKFELGYSLDSWDDFTKAALDKGFQLKYLEETGLTIVKQEEGKQYDRFRGRVMFPIQNVSGRTIGFGARTLKSNDKKSPKYVNSPESPIYHKSDVLYGMFQAKQSIRQEDECFLVEGYLDVLSLHQGGIENVVASSGTSLTENQIKLIGRYTKYITVLYDGDPAGIKASLRGIDLILEGGLNVNVVLFPDGDDPDSYIRRVGDTAFKAYLKEHSQDFISFKSALYAQEAKDNPVKKADAIREMVVSISKIPDAIKRSVFLQQCSLRFGIDEQVLISEYNKIHLTEQKNARHQAPPQPSSYGSSFDEMAAEAEAAAAAEAAMYEDENQAETSQNDVLQRREREVIRFILNYADKEIEEGLTASQFMLSELEDIEFKTPIYKRLFDMCRLKLEQGFVPTASEFMQHEDKEIRNEVIDLVSEKYELSDGWATHEIFVPREADLVSYGSEREVLRLKWRNVQMMIKDQMDTLPNLSNAQDLDKCLRTIKALKEFEKQIADLLGIVVSR